MPTAYASTPDAALQWSRLTTIHPAILSGARRWWFLAIQLGGLCLAVAGTAYIGRKTARAATFQGRPVASALRLNS
jgi:hypothetical protein